MSSRSSKPINVPSLTDIGRNPEFKTVDLFLKKKSDEAKILTPERCRQWVYKVLAKWSGVELFYDMCKNQRKMEIAYKLWKAEFYGFGLEGFYDHRVVDIYRAALKIALDEFNVKAALSKRKKDDSDLYEDKENEVDYVDYFNLEAAKLKNTRAVKKTIVGRKTPGNTGSTAKKRRMNPVVRRVSAEFGTRTPPTINKSTPGDLYLQTPASSDDEEYDDY